MCVSCRRRAALAAVATATALWGVAPAAAQSPGAGRPALASTPGSGWPSPFPTPVYGSWSLGGTIRDLPSSGNVWSLLETADPFTIVDRMDNGGLYGAEPARIGAHGASWTQTRFRLGGLDVTDPAGIGAPLLYPDLDALESVRVVSSLAPVDLGGAGPTVALVPRRPGAAWRVSLDAAANGAGLQSTAGASGAPAIARYGSWAGGHVRVSGPLVKDRVGLLLAGAVMRWRRVERSDPAPVGGDLASLLVHLVLTPRATDEIRVLALAQGRRVPYAGRALFANPDVGEDDTFWHLQGTWARRQARGATWTVTGGYQRALSRPLADRGTPGGTVERLAGGPLFALTSLESGLRERWDARVTVAPEPTHAVGGRHAVRAGLALTVARGDFVSVAPGAVAETVGGVPSRAWLLDAPPGGRRHETTVAAYVADRVRVRPHLALEAGLRFETSGGSADGASNGIRWSSISPRLSVRWTLDRAGRTAVFGGAAVYRQPLWLDTLAVGAPGSLCADVWRWRDVNGDGLLQPEGGELAGLVGVSGPGCTGAVGAGDTHPRQPSTRELVLGIERRLGDRFLVRLAGIDRRERNLIGLVNDGVTAADYAVGLVPDPGTDYVGGTTSQLLPVFDRNPASAGQDRYVLANPAGGRSRYQGVELTVETTPDRPLWMRLGATAYRNEGPGAAVGFGPTANDQGVLSAPFDAPNEATNAAGRLFFDRAYVVKWAAAYRAPHDVRLGVVARYQDGQPFARVVVVPGLTQGAEAVQAYPRGETRFTYTFTLDARMEKGFVVAGRRVAAVVEAFNLLGTANEVEENVVTGPSFRTTTAVQPPRTLRLGLLVDF